MALRLLSVSSKVTLRLKTTLPRWMVALVGSLGRSLKREWRFLLACVRFLPTPGSFARRWYDLRQATLCLLSANTILDPIDYSLAQHFNRGSHQDYRWEMNYLRKRRRKGLNKSCRSRHLHWIDQSTHPTQSIKQSIYLLIYQSITQTINRSIHQLFDQSINWLNDRSINRSLHQSS